MGMFDRAKIMKQASDAASKATTAAAAAKDSAVKAAKEQYEKTRPQVTAFVAEKRAQAAPMAANACRELEGEAKAFLKSPTGQWLKENPKTVIALLGVLAAIGVPGAAALSTGVQLAGVVPLLTPLLALFETTAPMFAHLV